MKDCPAGCGASLSDRAVVCNSCGWEAPRRGNGGNGTAADRIRRNAAGRRLCMHEDRGQFCAELGSLSSAMNGAGPDYCSQHFPPFRGMQAGRSVPPGGFESLRALIKRVEPFPAVDFEAEAERLAIQNEAK